METTADDELGTCPDCRGPVHVDARRCPNCGVRYRTVDKPLWWVGMAVLAFFLFNAVYNVVNGHGWW
jgi:hypothetical protein